MPKNINCITIIILEGIENIKTEKQWQQNSLSLNTSVYKLNGFYFPLMNIHNKSSEAG